MSCVVLNLAQVARTQHVQAESYLVYNIMTSREIECSNTLEDALDQALPSQAFIYRPVRQRVYSLLLGHITGEYSVPATPDTHLGVWGHLDLLRGQCSRTLPLCKPIM